MEIVVATLAHTVPGREADGQAYLHLISGKIQNADGLVNALFYRSRGNDTYYFLLTTWDAQDSWEKAQKRYSPKHLLQTSYPEILASSPEQWLLHYLWGYSRPAAVPTLAAAHFATVRPDQAERTQRGWIESLRRQAIQPNMSFAFLARGIKEEESRTVAQDRAFRPPPITEGLSTEDNSYQYGSIFLNLLSWASEANREEFYANPNYQAINRFLTGVGVIQILTLEPVGPF